MKIKKILTFVFAAALMTSCGNEDGPGGDGGNGGGTEHTEYFPDLYDTKRHDCNK